MHVGDQRHVAVGFVLISHQLLARPAEPRLATESMSSSSCDAVMFEGTQFIAG